MNPDAPSASKRPWSRPLTFRRLVMWCEAVIAGLLALLGIFSVSVGLLFADRDPHHGGAYPIIFGSFVLLTAGTLGFGAICLRGTRRAGWVPQILPVAILAWILWDIFSHPG